MPPRRFMPPALTALAALALLAAACAPTTAAAENLAQVTYFITSTATRTRTATPTGTLRTPTVTGTPPTATPTGTRTPTRTPTRLATLEGTATDAPPTRRTLLAPTLDPGPGPVIITPLATATPGPTRPAQVVGPFQAMLPLDWAAAGVINGMFPEDPDTIWFSAPAGLARLTVSEETVQQTKFDAPVTVLGLQPYIPSAERQGTAARLWFFTYGGAQAASWDGLETIYYGSNEGWVVPARPVTAPLPPVQQALSVSPSGEVWTATARDVRRFSSGRWRIFNATELGLPYIWRAGATSAYTVALLGSEPWAGSCNFQNGQPVGYGGLRRFDGRLWQDAGLPVDNPCVSVLQADGQGRLLAGVNGALWRFDPLSGAWSEFAPALSEDEHTPGYIREIAISPDGSAWPLVAYCDLTGCRAGQIRYHIVNGRWQEILRQKYWEEQRLAFNGDGQPWLFLKKGIHVVTGSGALRQVGDLNADLAAGDPRGNVWIITKNNYDPQLWKYTAP